MVNKCELEKKLVRSKRAIRNGFCFRFETFVFFSRWLNAECWTKIRINFSRILSWCFRWLRGVEERFAIMEREEEGDAKNGENWKFHSLQSFVIKSYNFGIFDWCCRFDRILQLHKSMMIGRKWQEFSYRLSMTLLVCAQWKFHWNNSFVWFQTNNIVSSFTRKRTNISSLRVKWIIVKWTMYAQLCIR